jgi:anti-anti-sigma regulatory factor
VDVFTVWLFGESRINAAAADRTAGMVVVMADVVRVGDLRAGDHACLTFSDAEEQLDLIAAFVRDGLRTGHKVICWTDSLAPDRLRRDLAGRSVRLGAAVRRGQVQIASAEAGLLSGGAAEGRTMTKVINEEVDRAGMEGYSGLRVTADMGWATRPLCAPEELLTFETEIAELFIEARLCLICLYDRDRFDAVTLAFAAQAHPRTVAATAYHDDVLLRICRQYNPPGIRAAGELDFRHRDALNTALAESIRLDRNPQVNLTGLDYIDAACATAIVHAARKLPRSRRMTIACTGAVHTVIRLIGADIPDRIPGYKPL